MTRLLPLLLVFGCATTTATGAFSYRFADNRLEDIEPILEALPSPSAPAVANASGSPLVVATTTSDTPEVLAIDVQSGDVRWRTALDAYSRPEVHGDVVMTTDRTNLVALDLGNGQELWRKPLNSLVYVGCARSGNTLACVSSVGASGGEHREGRIEAVDARSGRRVWLHEITGVLGKPAAVADLFLVPWDRQSIALLTASTGVEQARLRSNDDVIAWVEARAEGIFYGHRGIYRLGLGSATGNKEDAFYRPHPLPELPREPELHDDGFYPNPGRRSARGRIRVYFAPQAQGESPVSVVGDIFYYVYYRYVFAYDGEGTIRWAHTLSQDVINAEVTPSGLLTIGEEGAFTLLSAQSGAELWTGGVEGITLGSAGIDAANFTAAGGEGEAQDLRTALAEIVGDPDNRLVAARAHAVSLLSALDAPEITQDLLDLYIQRSTPGALREAIGTALQSRVIGTEFLVSALDQHFNYLEETRVPPFALIIPALLQQEVRGAVSGLVSHLMDHETPLDVMPLVARAIVDLGDESVVPPLQAFLVRYQADTTFAEAPQTLAVVAEGMFRHGGEDGRTMIQAVAAAPHTGEELTGAIQGLFEREVAAADATAQAEATAAAEAARAAAAAERAARPDRLSQAQINEVFAAQTESFRTCVEAELERNPLLGQLRFVFIIENTGQPRDMRYTPNTPELQSCLAPTVEALVFPRFQDRRQRARFVVNLRGGASEAAAGDDIDDNNWWAGNERRGASADTALGRPWWQPRTVAGAAEGPTAPPENPTPGETPPEGGETPPEGGETPPEGGETPPEGGETPPEGGETPPAGGEGEMWWLPEE
ncbi:MAG: outer membrane protein assembly factor BamB [Polyangiales bacterium]|jgi:outer membrane protein assembly factor BamB